MCQVWSTPLWFCTLSLPIPKSKVKSKGFSKDSQGPFTHTTTSQSLELHRLEESHCSIELGGLSLQLTAKPFHVGEKNTVFPFTLAFLFRFFLFHKLFPFFHFLSHHMLFLFTFGSFNFNLLLFPLPSPHFCYLLLNSSVNLLHFSVSSWVAAIVPESKLRALHEMV